MLICAILLMTTATVKTLTVWPGEAPGSYHQDAPETVVDGNVHHVKVPTITAYLPKSVNPKRPALIICPGGGYNVVCIDREGYRVAEWFSDRGIACFVLKYRLDGPQRGVALLDAQRAVQIVRANAKAWNVDPARVGMIGFSAGGHLAAATALEPGVGPNRDADPIARQDARPNFIGLIYGWLDPLTVAVTPQAPPAFMAHATNDSMVAAAQSEKFAEKYRKQGLPVELHLYKEGGHGFDMGVAGQDSAQWPTTFMAWMRATGFYG